MGGGRYDGLAETLGGPQVAGVGWAAGIERLAMLADKAESLPPPLVLIAIGDGPEETLAGLAAQLRAAGIRVEMPYSGNLGKQMKRADRLGARIVAMQGSDEAKAGVIRVRDMTDGSQQDIPLANAPAMLRSMAAES